MKKGNKVIVRDGSWSRNVINGKLIHEAGSLLGKQYTVVEINCKFPVLDSLQSCYESEPRFNNTVIQAIDSGQVIFIEERFLELVLPTHKVMIDLKSTRCAVLESGLVVEISDELYKQIKK